MGTVSTNTQVMHHNPYMKPPVCYTMLGLKVWIKKSTVTDRSVPQYCFSLQEDFGCTYVPSSQRGLHTTCQTRKQVCIHVRMCVWCFLISVTFTVLQHNEDAVSLLTLHSHSASSSYSSPKQINLSNVDI